MYDKNTLCVCMCVCVVMGVFLFGYGKADLAYNIALCHYKTKHYGPCLKHIAEIITTIDEIARHEVLGATFPVLAQAARRVGGPQIRNAGTIGGNLCNASPCADTALPLLALPALRQAPRREPRRHEAPIFLDLAELFVSGRVAAARARLSRRSPSEHGHRR